MSPGAWRGPAAAVAAALLLGAVAGWDSGQPAHPASPGAPAGMRAPAPDGPLTPVPGGPRAPGAAAIPAAPLRQAESTLPALAGKVVVVDPGHGGRDPGARGISGSREKDITLAIALQLRDLLVQSGARPVMTRETDVDLRDRALPGETTIRRGELAARAQLAVEHQAHVLVSIHANKYGRQSPWRGAQVFYDPRGHAGSPTLARMLQEELRERTQTSRVHRPIEQFVLARAPVPAVTVEVGFLSNPEEERLLLQPDYQQRLAYAIFAGLARYLAAQPGATMINITGG